MNSVPHGLFVGLVTLDLVYLTAAGPPQPNQKIAALDYMVAAGGPATNAAVTFSALGGQSTLLSLLGQHPITHLVRADLEQWGVTIADLDPQRRDPPPVSSIVVSQGTGDRAVVSLNASRTQAEVAAIPSLILQGIDVVLVDAHQMAVGRAVAQQAQAEGIPVVLDGGSWKPGLETLLPHIDYAICSANFLPPGCQTEADVFAYLQAQGITWIGITHGEQPIAYQTPQGAGKIPVPQIQAIDTLGAGDIFHGAFCFYLGRLSFLEALEQAAAIAALACTSFGSRQWLRLLPQLESHP